MYFYCTYPTKTKILSMCVLGTFWKSQKVIILSEKSICPNSKNRFSQNTNHRQSANISLPQKFRATRYVLLIQFQWNCPGDEIHVRKEEIYGHFLSVLKRNYTLNHNKLTRNSSEQLLLLYYYTHFSMTNRNQKGLTQIYSVSSGYIYFILSVYFFWVSWTFHLTFP